MGKLDIKRFFLTVLWALPFVGFTQEIPFVFSKDIPLNQFNSQHWTTLNGLPTNSLLHIKQSSEGYIWITGYSGIIRFDGVKFTNFNEENTPVFKTNSFGRIMEDSAGTLWFTSQGSGLIAFKNGKFESYGASEGIHDLNWAIYIDEQNKVWASSAEKGVFYFKDEKFVFPIANDSIAGSEVFDIVKGFKDEIYFGTIGNGLIKYEHGELTQIASCKQLNSLWVNCLYKINDSMLWIVTSKGLFSYDGNKIHKHPYKEFTSINSLDKDYNVFMWAGTNSGIVRINPSDYSLMNIDRSSEALSKIVNGLTIDNEGNLWYTTYKGGLTQVKNGMFTNYNKSSGLEGKIVNTICEMEPNNYLLAFDNGKMNLIKNRKVYPYKTKTNIEGMRIRHILYDSENSLWISTYNGLLQIDSKGNEVFYSPANGFPSGMIRITYEDSKHNLWIGTRDVGLIKREANGKLKIFDGSVGFNSILVMSIKEHNGKIYVGTNSNGLYIIDNDEVVNVISMDSGLPSNLVFNTHMDKDQVLWVATNRGLARIEDDSISVLNIRNGLFNNSPYDILEDSLSNLWMPTAVGVMKFNKKAINVFFQEKDTSRLKGILYNQSNGMSQFECNATAMAVHAADNSFLFPTIDGMVQIYPSKDVKNNIKPNVVIEAMIVNDEPTDLNKPIFIPPGRNRIKFEFTALSLHEPLRNQFKYRLIGYDTAWVNISGNRNISFTNLKPGTYVFQVIASNNDKVWNLSGKSLAFKVQPKFYQTRVFLFGAAILFLLLIYIINYLNIRRYKRQQHHLETIVKRRTNEISNKNKVLEEQKQEILSQSEKLIEQKGQLEKSNQQKDKMFSIISHDLRGPISSFNQLLELLIAEKENLSDKEKDQMLKMMHDSSENVYALLENLLDWAKAQMSVSHFNPTLFEINPLISEVVRLARPLADKKGINLHHHITNTMSVYADLNMLRTILRNLIFNALKFTHPDGTVDIFARETESFIEFCIQDSGVGLSKKAIDNLFLEAVPTTTLGTNKEKGSGLGLLLCYEFVNLNGGRIWVESESGKGSKFFFTLKKTNSN